MTSRRIRPLKAYRHFRNLIKDKEDTTQVFEIIEALDGSNLEKDFKRFVKTHEGQARFAERKNLVPLLDDHETLRNLPMGSVGQHYCDFMESQGLSAQGLVDEYDRWGKRLEDFYDADVSWFGNRRRDVHDLMHIMVVTHLAKPVFLTSPTVSTAVWAFISSLIWPRSKFASKLPKVHLFGERCVKLRKMVNWRRIFASKTL